MTLLHFVGVSTTWQRCAECGYLVNPVILAQFHAAPRASFHCFRCYHILAAVRIPERAKQGGA